MVDARESCCRVDAVFFRFEQKASRPAIVQMKHNARANLTPPMSNGSEFLYVRRWVRIYAGKRGIETGHKPYFCFRFLKAGSVPSRISMTEALIAGDSMPPET